MHGLGHIETTSFIQELLGKGLDQVNAIKVHYLVFIKTINEKRESARLREG